MAVTNTETANSACPGDIHVIPGRSKFDVEPGVFFADPGGTYWIRNHTRYTVLATFPPEVVSGGAEILLGPKDTAQACQQFTTRSDGEDTHYYVVQVFFFGIEERRDEALYASGGSDPRVVFR